MFQEGWNHQPVMELGDRLDVLSLVRGTIPYWNMIDQWLPEENRVLTELTLHVNWTWSPKMSSSNGKIIFHSQLWEFHGYPLPRQEPVSKAR